MFLRRSGLAAAALWTLLFAMGDVIAADEQACTALAQQDFGRIQDAPTRVTAAAVTAAADQVPAYCKVEGYVSPAVGIEVRLPMQSWNGKLLFAGCGAMCGSMLGAASCNDAVARGYACATTDMGHRAPAQDGKWAYNNPIAEIDAGHRATHVATLASKAITAAFYGTAIQRSYYRGCSTGGRQGLVAAQRYPFDYDGIIAGAPVLYQLMGPPLQLFWGVQSNLDAAGNPIMSHEKLPALYAASVKACDKADGVEDGLVDRPMQCKFDPAVLRCTGAASNDCLTDAEIEVARRMYAGPPQGKLPWATSLGLLPGSEMGWEGYLRGGKASSNYGFAAELMRYVVFDQDPGPSLEPTSFDWEKDPQRLSLSTMSAANPDMSLFQRAGGKLIMFHGLADSAIMATSTMTFYDMMTRTAGGLKELQAFARLYLPAGLNHCTGGAGLNTVDFLGALERWVEKGAAPEALMAFHAPKTAPNAAIPVPFNPDEVTLARQVFPYPDRAVYKGGDWKDPGSFKRGR